MYSLPMLAPMLNHYPYGNLEERLNESEHKRSSQLRKVQTLQIKILTLEKELKTEQNKVKLLTAKKVNQALVDEIESLKIVIRGKDKTILSIN
jgi:uncharacterized coiled-coil protein SlyX